MRIPALIFTALLLLFACGMGQRADAPPPEFRVDVLMAETHGGGGGQAPSAAWITSRKQLDRLSADRKSRQLPAKDVNADLDVDFAAFHILMIRMGQKPTAGYSLKLDPESCSISRNTAYVGLIWSEPAPGMAAAQVITSPYILLKITKGGYDSVKIVDQHDQLRFDLPTSP